MKRCLITGAAGFVPSHTLEYLLKTTDWEFIGLVRMSRAGDLNRVQHVLDINPEYRKRVEIIRHDLLDPLDAIHKHIGKVNYVVHMAADSHVDDSLTRRKSVFMNNAMSTVNVLEYCLQYQSEVEKVIYYSTDEVYGGAGKEIAFKEGDALNPTNPYSAGKAAGEMAVNAWREISSLPLLIMNTMNMFGERQDPEKMIPKTIGRYLQGFPAIVHTSGEEIGARYWLHAQNSADAIRFCLENDIKERKVHIPGQVEINNFEICRLIADIMGIPFKYEMTEVDKIRPGYDRRYSVDGSKIMALGWKHPIDFTDSLVETVLWTVDNPKWLGV